MDVHFIHVRSANENALPLIVTHGWPGAVIEGRRARCAVDVSLPVGFTAFPGEIWRTPRSWVETAYPNVVYYNAVDRGGHFAACEEPELFSEEIRAAFSSMR